MICNDKCVKKNIKQCLKENEKFYYSFCGFFDVKLITRANMNKGNERIRLDKIGACEHIHKTLEAGICW